MGLPVELSDPEGLSTNNFANTNMQISTDTIPYTQEPFIQTLLTKEMKPSHFEKSNKNKILVPTNVIIDCKGDKTGFIAQSEKYFNYFGMGKNKEESIEAFIEMFTDKKDGENLSNVCFIIQ